MNKKKRNFKWVFLIVFIIVIIFLISYFGAKSIGKKPFEEKIAVIPINGVISADGARFSFESGVSSSLIVDFIEKANEDKSIKGIILEINSPGGSVVASKEIANAVENCDKPVVAWIRETGASGGYWIASSADKIIADPLSITGSIGVVGSYLEFSDFMEEWGIGYEELKTGNYKDTGSPFRELREDEKKILQGKLEIIHDFFVREVARNRGLEVSQMDKISDGMFLLGEEAKELGLVDYLGGKDEAKRVIKELTGAENIKLVSYKKKTTIFDLFGGISMTNSYFMGRGIGSEMYKSMTENRFSLMV